MIKYSAGIYPGFVWELDNIPDKWKESFKLIDNKIVKFIYEKIWFVHPLLQRRIGSIIYRIAMERFRFIASRRIKRKYIYANNKLLKLYFIDY